MPYYHSGTIGPETTPLQDFTASPSLARSTAFDDALAGNPTSVLYQNFRLWQANQGERLSQEEAQSVVQDAGVNLQIPDSGYTRDALNILIERKRDEHFRQDVLARAPGGFWQTAGRFGMGLAASVLDPLNVASAFIPIVGEARYASMLERAGTGAFARAMVRARVGALEGAVGAAALEPGVYLGRTELQDDYTMADSLLNVAFGTVLGGGLHAVGGRVKDYFTGVGKAPKGEPSGEIAADVGPMDKLQQEISPRMDAADLVTPEPQPPFRLLGDLTLEDARSLAFQELTPQFRQQLIGEAGNEAPRGTVSDLRDQSVALQDQITSASDVAEFKRIAKDFQGQGLSRKQAESQARKQVADTQQELQGRLSAIEQQVEGNRAAAAAQQDLAAIDRGEIPVRFSDEVEMRARQIQTQGELQRALSAGRVAELATPQARRDALRVAVAQMAQGKVTDVEPIIRMMPQSEVMSAARRSAAPEASSAADFASSRAADERVKSETSNTADNQLNEAVQKFSDVRQNLERAGYSPERLQAIDRELAAFDQNIENAKSLGAASRAAALCGVRV